MYKVKIKLLNHKRIRNSQKRGETPDPTQPDFVEELLTGKIWFIQPQWNLISR